MLTTFYACLRDSLDFVFFAEDPGVDVLGGVEVPTAPPLVPDWSRGLKGVISSSSTFLARGDAPGERSGVEGSVAVITLTRLAGFLRRFWRHRNKKAAAIPRRIART